MKTKEIKKTFKETTKIINDLLEQSKRYKELAHRGLNLCREMLERQKRWIWIDLFSNILMLISGILLGLGIARGLLR